MAEGTKRKDFDDSPTLAAEMLARARGSELPWTELRALAGRERVTDAHRRAVRRLVVEGSLLELGEQGRQQRYAVVRGSAHETFVRLGCELLRKRAKGRLGLYPGTATGFKSDRSVPSRLRAALPDALKALVQSGEAFIVKAGRGASYFLLRADVEATLAAQPLTAAALQRPAAEVLERVPVGYRSFSRE